MQPPPTDDHHRIWNRLSPGPPNITPIFCVGETLEQRQNNETFNHIEHQLTTGLSGFANLTETRVIIAYEPIWAIGTGKVASPDEAQDVHAFIRNHISKTFGSFR